jgi:hypothetical protein
MEAARVTFMVGRRRAARYRTNQPERSIRRLHCTRSCQGRRTDTTPPGTVTGKIYEVDGRSSPDRKYSCESRDGEAFSRRLLFVHRQGVSHLRYLPLVSRTVEDPLEVWESTKAIYHRGTTLLFSPTLSRREFGNKSHGSRRREYWLGGHGIQHRRRCVRGASRRIVSFC